MFSDLLNETKVFKNQLTVKVLLKKYKLNREIQFAPLYFNSVTKTVINHKFRQKIIFRKCYTWLLFELIMDLAGMLNQVFEFVESNVESQYVNISTYRPLSGSIYRI